MGSGHSAVVDVRSEVERQKRHDRTGGSGRRSIGAQSVLRARIGAVLAAQRAFSEGQQGARWALRQSLIDLAAISETLAEELPAPQLLVRQ